VSVGAIRDPAVSRPEATLHPPPARAKPAATDGPSPFARLLEGLGREVQRGESLMRGALEATHTGIHIGPTELIALQAGVYRYGEAVDLASRLIDRATGSVKTIVQGQ
jgi:hypothetical protein